VIYASLVLIALSIHNLWIKFMFSSNTSASFQDDRSVPEHNVISSIFFVPASHTLRPKSMNMSFAVGDRMVHNRWMDLSLSHQLVESSLLSSVQSSSNISRVIDTEKLNQGMDSNMLVHTSFLSSDLLYYSHPIRTVSYDSIVWNTPDASVIAKIRDAKITRNGLVSNGSGTYTFGKWYWQNDVVLSKKLESQNLKRRAYLSLIQIWNDSFQHIVFDTIPNISFVCSFVRFRSDIIVLVMNLLQRDLVREFCPIDDSRFSILTSNLHASEIYVPYFSGTNLQMGMVPPRSIRSLGSQNTRGFRVVYLSRKYGTKRSVGNENEVLVALRIHFPGMQVVSLHDDWRQDRHVVQQASIIVGPHGGAMSNMIFAPINTTIIEFLPLRRLKKSGQNSRPCFFGLAHGLGFSYFSVEPENFDFLRPMIVPINVLVDTVVKIQKQGLSTS